MLQEFQINGTILHRFASLMTRNHLAHAYLLLGPSDIGKAKTALAVAKLINCENNKGKDLSDPCDECSSCLRINQGNHPDVYMIEGGLGNPIKIEQIRDLLQYTHLKPYESKKKVFIIRDVENLTMEGANAFLKTLEEPSNDTLLLLTSSFPKKVLSTIRSRCQEFHFYPSPKADLEDYLKNHYHVDKIGSHFLTYLAEGFLGKAKRYQQMAILEKRNEMIDNFIFSRNSEIFIKKLSSEKEKIKDFLEILSIWVRDAILLKAGAEERHLVCIDRLKELEIFQSKFSFARLQDLHQEIIQTFKSLTDNLNVKIPLLILKDMMIEV